jgi:putative ABC transport system ATP-binding protein
MLFTKTTAKAFEVALLETIVEAIDLKKTYMLGKIPVEALKGVNLKIEKGDFVSILGPSGSGKSTLLNLLGALDKPTSGQLLIQNTDLSKLNDNQLTEVRSRIGFVFQFFNLIPRFTAKANVELSMMIKGVDRSERQRRVAQVLDDVGLKERVNHKPAELSGGQQQRVAIARALANNPSFLLLDEPTGNVDSKTAKDILGLIKQLNSEGVTIIMVTHDQTIAKMAKRTIQVFDGQITSDEAN